MGSISILELPAHQMESFVYSEANPLAFICEQAGGRATNGEQRILEISPTELHQRVPLYIGSTDLIQQYEDIQKGLVNV